MEVTAVYVLQAGSATWEVTSASNQSVAGSALSYVGQVVPRPAFVPELPHDPSAGPMDALTGTALAIGVTYAAVRGRACHFPDGFYFRRQP
jgi:hypothetical protein